MSIFKILRRYRKLSFSPLILLWPIKSEKNLNFKRPPNIALLSLFNRLKKASKPLTWLLKNLLQDSLIKSVSSFEIQNFWFKIVSAVFLIWSKTQGFLTNTDFFHLVYIYSFFQPFKSCHQWCFVDLLIVVYDMAGDARSGMKTKVHKDYIFFLK